MSGTLEILVLASLACLATFLLQRGGRQGNGWVTGSEFVLIGLAVGPAGLDAISDDLLDQARPVIALAVAWLGLRLGLRLRPAEMKPLPGRLLLASQIEPLLTLLVLRVLLGLAGALQVLHLESMTAWALAAVGSASTRSAAVWARAQFGARGPAIDAITAVSSLGGSVGLIGVAAAYAALHPPGSGLPPGVAPVLAATLVLGLGLGALILLTTSSGPFRPDVAWVAVLGACALGTGLATQLGLCAAAATGVAGLLVGALSPFGWHFDELTRPTERPAVQVLMVLGAAQVPAHASAWIAALVFVALRFIAKLVGGAGAGSLLRIEGRPLTSMGVGLLAGGGLAFALAVGLAPCLPAAAGAVLVAQACAMIIAGDLLGSPALRRLLRRRGEIPSAPSPLPAPAGAPA